MNVCVFLCHAVFIVFPPYLSAQDNKELKLMNFFILTFSGSFSGFECEVAFFLLISHVHSPHPGQNVVFVSAPIYCGHGSFYTRL
jgi:hypothetical protein